MRGRHRLLIALATVLALLVGGLGVLAVVLHVTTPAPLALAENQGRVAPLISAQAPGTWTVASGSTVGYRVGASVSLLPVSADQVGRTSRVQGTVGISNQDSISSVSMTVDMATLSSGDPAADAEVAAALDTREHPLATFRSSRPARIQMRANGTGSASVSGTLTIRGRPLPVTLPVVLQTVSGTLWVTGSGSYAFASFGVTPPQVDPFVKVAPTFTLEIQLRMTPARVQAVP